MSVTERSFGSILREIVDALQDLLRAELALARREVTEDFSRMRAALVAMAAGAVVALLGAHLLLWSAVYALGLRLPLWGGAEMGEGVWPVGGGVVIQRGWRRWRGLSMTPERTVATIKENVAWLKPSSR